MRVILRMLVVVEVLLLAGCYTAKPNTEQNLALAAQYNTQLGLAYLDQGQPDAAYQKLQLACKEAPSQASAYAALAFYYQKQQQYDLAAKMYQQALNLSPHDSEILNNYGAFLCQQAKYEAGQELLRQALEDQNIQSREKIVLNQAICSEMAGDFKQAKQDLRVVLAINSQQGLARQMLDELDFHH